MDSSVGEPLLRNDSGSEKNEEPNELVSTDAHHRRNSLMLENFRYPCDVDERYIKTALVSVEDKKAVEILKKVEKRRNWRLEKNKTIGEDNEMKEPEEKEEKEDKDDDKDPDDEEEISDEKLYSEFLKWKVFENVFEHQGDMSLFEVEKEGKRIAFRLDDIKCIKIIRVDERKEYTFQENDECPIEFLKFIEQGKKIVMANRLFIYILDLATRKLERFDILAKYKAENLPLINIVSKIANDFSICYIDERYYMIYTISQFIFSIKFNKTLKSCTLKYSTSSSSIQNFFTGSKRNLIFSMTSPEKGDYILETRTASTLALRHQARLKGEITYFSYPILTSLAADTKVKFIYLMDFELRYIEFIINHEVKNGDTANSKSELNIVNSVDTTELLETPSFPIESAFKDKYSIKTVWYATNQMIIIDYETNAGWGGASEFYQTIYDSRLFREIKTFAEPNAEVIVDNSIIFAYSKYSLSIITVGAHKFEGNLSFPTEILSLSVISNYIFVKFQHHTSCWKLHVNKGTRTVSRHLDENDYEKIADLNPAVSKRLTDVLCFGRDSKSLNIFLKNQDKFKIDSNIETLNIGKSIENQSTECTRVLFDYYITLDADTQKSDAMVSDIEENFTKIVGSGAPNLIQFLDNLLKSETVVGKPYAESIPEFQFYENKTESLDRLFLSQNTSGVTEYEIQSTLIQLPNICGSKDSIELSKALCDCDTSIYTSSLIKYYIKKKWDDIWLVIAGQAVVLWINCLLVLILIINDSRSIPILLALMGINGFLVFAEVIQIINLGFESYIGLEDIHYFGNLSFIISLVFLYVRGFYIAIPYGIVQLLSMHFDSKTKLREVGIRSIPYIITFVSWIFTDDIMISFFLILAYELTLATLSSFSGRVGEIARSYARVIATLIFIGYSSNNIWLLSFIACIYMIERVYEFVKIKPSNFTRRNIFYMIIETVTLTLVVLSYFLESELYSIISILIALPLQALLCYLIIHSSQEFIENFRTYSACYSFYLLIAYIDTSSDLFLICFIFTAFLELLYLKIFALHHFKSDIGSMLLNWNTLDICRALITFTWILLALFDATIPNEVSWFFACLNFIRGLTGFRAFDGTRFYVRLILGSVLDISSFLYIFIYITVAFGVINYTTGNVDSENIFEIIWIIPYDMAFGNIAHDENLDLGYISFFVASLLVIIVMLNLLISILGDSFGKFQEGSAEIDYMEMIETIYECEVLLFWRASINSKSYFAICDLPWEKPAQDNITEKLEEMQGKIEGVVKETQAEIIRSSRGRAFESEKKLDGKLSELEKQIHEIKLIVSEKYAQE